MFSSECALFFDGTCEPFELLRRSFLQLADMRLTESQKRVLCAGAEVLKWHRFSMTKLADVVSRRTGIPYSTVKWNLRSLMDMGLIVANNGRSRGAKVLLTDPALMLVAHLQNEE